MAGQTLMHGTDGKTTNAPFWRWVSQQQQQQQQPTPVSITVVTKTVGADGIMSRWSAWVNARSTMPVRKRTAQLPGAPSFVHKLARNFRSWLSRTCNVAQVRLVQTILTMKTPLAGSSAESLMPAAPTVFHRAIEQQRLARTMLTLMEPL
jgi:hypothetical protein